MIQSRSEPLGESRTVEQKCYRCQGRGRHMAATCWYCRGKGVNVFTHALGDPIARR